MRVWHRRKDALEHLIGEAAKRRGGAGSVPLRTAEANTTNLVVIGVQFEHGLGACVQHPVIAEAIRGPERAQAIARGRAHWLYGPGMGVWMGERDGGEGVDEGMDNCMREAEDKEDNNATCLAALPCLGCR